MGNIGRSSTGCALCRKRKIKCDEGRPGCKRCTQIRKSCPGYPYQIRFDVLLPDTGSEPPASIKPETITGVPVPLATNALKVTSISSSPKLESTKHDEAIKEEEADENAILLRTVQHEPESPPKYDVQHQSICFFMNLFCWQAGKLYSFPVLDFLPHVLGGAPTQSPIHVAATAVSRMTLADQYSGKDVRLQTRKTYVEALELSGKAIRDPRTNTLDDTVVSVWLLGLYEAIHSVLNHGRGNNAVAKPQDEMKSHVSHIRGAMQLLKLRGAAQFDHSHSEKIFRIFKAAIQMRLFTLNSVTSRDFGKYELDMYTDEHEFVPSATANRATNFFLKVARLIESIKDFLTNIRASSNESTTIKQTQRLIEYTISLDREMIGWSEQDPGWQMMPVRGEGESATWSLYPNHARSYFHSFWVYLYWIRYLIARHKLYESLIVLTRSNHEYADECRHTVVQPQIDSYIAIIREVASDLIGLTAYAIGDVAADGKIKSSRSPWSPSAGFREMNVIAAMQLFLPFKTLLRSPYTTQEQKGAIDLAIIHIGDGFRRIPPRPG